LRTESESGEQNGQERGRSLHRLRTLFLATLYLSTFTFGGGYVIVSLLKNKFVDELHWIDDDEMLDLVAIAQSSPGAIAVNGAIVVGYKIAGMPGVLAAVLGAVIPPFVILTVVSAFYNAFKSNFVVQSLLTGMKSGVSAVIISVVYDMGAGIVKDRNRIRIAVMIIAFILNYYLNVNVVYIIIATALLGAAVTVVSEKRNKDTGGSVSAEREQNEGVSAGRDVKKDISAGRKQNGGTPAGSGETSDGQGGKS
jgi:chromate transporter